ncbi:MAG: hypothetical protein ACF8CQ_21495 [Rhodopirellula sp. JB044]|uniref:hypothetical protein n=1 Tax=Rhodopirellula sp. JB044 TaxID=3342844 RepID=UPI00370B5C35
MKRDSTLKLTIWMAVVLVFSIAMAENTNAQRPRRGGGGQAGPPRMQRDAEVDETQAMLSRAQQNATTSQASALTSATQNMPTIEQLATMMLANFDADESGGLDQTELQSALAALRQMMQAQSTQATDAATQARMQASGFRGRGR